MNITKAIKRILQKIKDVIDKAMTCSSKTLFSMFAEFFQIFVTINFNTPISKLAKLHFTKTFLYLSWIIN